MSDEDIFSGGDDVNEVTQDDDLDEFLGGATATLDFTKADIPEALYLMNIKRVTMQVQEPTADKKGKFQLAINMQIDAEDYEPQRPWNGQFFTDFMYLGQNAQDVSPLSLKKLQAFVAATTGEVPEGILDWRSLGYYKDPEGRRCLRKFEGLPVGVQLVKETGGDGVERLKAKVYKNAENLQRTAVGFGEEPF